MKKVGIMSMQRIHNYGSFMQAYGLMKLIQKLNYNTEFVDYNFEKELVAKNKRSIIKRVFSHINIIEYIKMKKTTNCFHNRFRTEFIPYLCGNSYNYLPNDIASLVIGSDEVFNCLQAFPVGYSRELFGKNYEEIPVISYAACFGQTNFDRLQQYGISNEVSSLLNNFKSISVRDNNSYETVFKLIGKKSNINLDPVLIYDYDEEIIDNVSLKDYILIYAYSGRLSRNEEKIIKKFSKREKKKIVSLGMYQRIADYNIVVHPFELFSYFKHADFVITDTFHGSIFSIKNHTKFCTIIRNNTNGNSNKLVDLLKRLKLEDRIITDLNNLNNYYLNEIDYSLTDEIIMREKNRTIDYLKKNLKESD